MAGVETSGEATLLFWRHCLVGTGLRWLEILSEGGGIVDGFVRYDFGSGGLAKMVALSGSEEALWLGIVRHI